MWLFILAIVALVIILVGTGIVHQKYTRDVILGFIPGPAIKPLIGNALDCGDSPEGIHNFIVDTHVTFGDTYQIWIGPFRKTILTADTKIIEKVLASNTNTAKSEMYQFLEPWLGTGLIVSKGQKWFKRRKMLTPAFHFNILDQSIDKIWEASNQFVQNLRKHINGEAFDIFQYASLCGLDIICETAMGMEIHAQTQSDSEYVQAVRNICFSVAQRWFNFLEMSDFYFNNFSSNGKRFNEALKVLHSTADKVIVERRKTLLEPIRGINKGTETKAEENEKKKRMFFLDALLKSTIDGKPLSNADIREEVDTFMFAGHDTVSTCISFTLYLLSKYQEVQDKLYWELRTILGDGFSTTPSLAQLNSLKYMEYVIKESLRLYPPVPRIGRTLAEDLELEKGIIPAKTKIILDIFGMHRKDEYFAKANEFNPERFLDDVASNNRFCYVPFSAGARNCIGQKFAMIEVKCVLVAIIRNYIILAADSKDEPKLSCSIILKSTNGINLKITDRNNV